MWNHKDFYLQYAKRIISPRNGLEFHYPPDPEDDGFPGCLREYISLAL